jgi:hypothetical protein
MARKIYGPRKQRTRQHVIADLGIHHVEGFVLDVGHTVQRLNPDYGYDLVLFTHDESGFIEPGTVFIQVKASEGLTATGSNFVFDLNVRDYNLWMMEEFPVILILFEASSRHAYWLPIQKYFLEDTARLPRIGAKTVRVRIPVRQRVNRRAIGAMRDLKREILGLPARVEP